MLGCRQPAPRCLMLSKIINGIIGGLITWSITHSTWVALAVFGAAAGLSSGKHKWADEIVKSIKDEVAKSKDASDRTRVQSTVSVKSSVAKLAAKLTTKLVPKHAVPAMLKHKSDSPGATADKTSMN